MNDQTDGRRIKVPDRINRRRVPPNLQDAEALRLYVLERMPEELRKLLGNRQGIASHRYGNLESLQIAVRGIAKRSPKPAEKRQAEAYLQLIEKAIDKLGEVDDRRN